MIRKKNILLLLITGILVTSCFEEIDTEPLPLPPVEDHFITSYSIKTHQSYYQIHETYVDEQHVSKNTDWDLAFESAGSGYRVMLGWASFSTGLPSGKFDFGEISLELFEEMLDTLAGGEFDDPTFVNTMDSLALTNHWENGEIWLQNRGTSEDNYYAIQYVSSNENSYTFRYASAQSLEDVRETTVYRVPEFNYVYYSYSEHRALLLEPDKKEWDILFTPYRGWWETDNPGVYSPFNMSGIMINNEMGVRVAHVFDPEMSFAELDLCSVQDYEFIEKKGAIGADWKVLGDPDSGNIFSVDTDKKYLLKKIVQETDEVHYYKLQIISYRNKSSEDHYPTVEFKYLGSE